MKDTKEQNKNFRERIKSTDSSADPQSVSSLIGQGIYQKALIVFLCVFIATFQAFNNLPQYLILLEPEFSCAPPNIFSLGDGSLSYNISVLKRDYPDYDIVNGKLTYVRRDSEINPFSLFLELRRECYLRNQPTVPCPNGYKYKTDFIYDTIVSKYDWVCDNASPKFLAHSLYWAGSIIGVLVIGQVSDK